MLTLALILASATPVVAPVREKVTMTIDETPFVPVLARELGYFDQEGIEIVPIRISDVAPNDFEMQKPMRDGQIEVAYHWFSHTIFGARHGIPITAVMTFNDAPGMTVLVTKTSRALIRSAADLGGKTIAAGAGYGMKALMIHTLAARHGPQATRYTLVAQASAGREAAILAGVERGTIDIVSAEEPLTSTVRATGLVDTLYDLTDRRSTISALGAPLPAQSLLMSPNFIMARPAVAQRVVNAFVRTMRWVNTHSAEEIAARLPTSYFEGKDRAQQIAYIKATLPSYARGDYSVAPEGAALVAASIEDYTFDASASGRWRASKTVPVIDLEDTYDNRFVQKAMKGIK